MAVQLDACIQCNLCVRACREVQVNDVIGMAARGHHEKIVFDFDDPMGDSTCVACGECVQACPTGALDAGDPGRRRTASTPTRPTARSTASAPIAASAASSPTRSEDDRIVAVEGSDGPANHNRLCVKGRFGFDYVHHPRPADRAADPQGGRPQARHRHRPGQPLHAFPQGELGRGARPSPPRASSSIRDRDGRRALAGFGSAKGSNEEAYLFQKLVRTGFGSNNVDHCTRLCHASSVAALMEGIGSGAVTAPFTAARRCRRHHRHRRATRP